MLIKKAASPIIFMAIILIAVESFFIIQCRRSRIQDEPLLSAPINSAFLNLQEEVNMIVKDKTALPFIFIDGTMTDIEKIAPNIETLAEALKAERARVARTSAKPSRK